MVKAEYVVQWPKTPRIGLLSIMFVAPLVVLKLFNQMLMGVFKSSPLLGLVSHSYRYCNTKVTRKN